LLYYILDCETTGLNESYNEVVEISVIRFEDKMQITRAIRAQYPERASLDALRTIGKNKYQICQGQLPIESVNDITMFINLDGASPKKRCVIAHNASFDRRFMHYLWKSNNLDFPIDYWVCSMALMRKYNKQIGIKTKVNLQDSCDSLGIVKVAGLHNAKSDTRNTYKLWKKLTEELKVDYLPLIENHAMGQSSEEDLSGDLYQEELGE